MPTEADELLPVYFSSGRQAGHALPRSEIHRLGLWHPTIQCWIVHRRPNGAWGLLLQERHSSKDAWPGRLDTTSAGHVLLGDTDSLREVEEELGVRPRPDELFFLGVRHLDDVDSDRILDRELQQTYLWINQMPLESYAPRPGEVSALVEVSIPDIQDLRSGKATAVPATRLTPGGTPQPVVITPDMLVPERDAATLKVLAAVGRIGASPPGLPLVPGWGTTELVKPGPSQPPPPTRASAAP